jgi:YegS/Rv2252/BmrU family lipid kinase
MNVVVVVNLHSSRAHAALPALREAIAKSDFDVRGFYECDDEKSLCKHIKRAVRDNMDAVIVGGGDGTIVHAVNALAHRSTILGVVPLGTGNSFADTIGIARHDVHAAIAVIAERRVVHIDLGCVLDRYFANFATIGLPAAIGNATPAKGKALIGKAAYVMSAIKPILTRAGFRAKIKWKGGKLDVETQQIVVASGRCFGPSAITPDASITDGKLALFTIDGTDRATIVATYIAMALGRQTRLPGAHALSAPSFTIRAKKKQPIAIDGDPLGTTPATFSVAPKALRVFVPEAFAKAWLAAS